MGKDKYLLLIGDSLLPGLDGSLAQGEVQVLEGIGSLDTHLLPVRCCSLPALKSIHQLPASLPSAAKFVM